MTCCLQSPKRSFPKTHPRQLTRVVQIFQIRGHENLLRVAFTHSLRLATMLLRFRTFRASSLLRL